jgi:hypothetical protein
MAASTGYLVNWETGENLDKHLARLKASLAHYNEMMEYDSGWDTRHYGGEPFDEKTQREIERVEKRMAELVE